MKSFDYSELLQQPEWNAKRYEVFEKNNFECQECKNNNFFIDKGNITKSYIEKGTIIEITKTRNVLELFNQGDSRFHKYRYRVRFCGVNISTVFTSEILSNQELNDLNINEFIGCEIYFFGSSAFFTDTNTHQDRVIFRIINKKLEDDKKLFYIIKLQAHHTFYEKGKKPWQYNKGIITLCENCHGDFHQNNEVPIKNSEGLVIDYLPKGNNFQT